MRPPGTRRWDLLTIGDPCADDVIAVESVPVRGSKTVGRFVGTFAGGTEANVACAAARLGGRVGVFGRVGDDARGQLLKDAFERDNVATDHLVQVAGERSATTAVLLDATGEKSVVYQPMPSAPLDLARLDEALRVARVVYLMPYALDDLLAVSRLARERGSLVAIDLEAAVAPDTEAMQARISAADIVFFNEEGFRRATGKSPNEETLAAVRRSGPSLVAVTLGGAGAVALDKSGFAHQPAFATQVVDTTGAGDTFNAAFLVAYLSGEPLAVALRNACAAASCTVAARGARPGMPDRAHVAQVLAANGDAGVPRDDAAPSRHLVVFGSINGDVLVEAGHLPLPGETVLGSQMHASPGGKGANQAHAAALYGAPTALYGMVGDDLQAAPALAQLKAHGVAVCGVGTASAQPTGLALVTVEPGGENTIVVVAGANRCARAAQVPDDILRAGGLLLLQLEVEPNESLRLAARARRLGCRVLLNASPMPKLFTLRPGTADILIVNRVELSQLCSASPHDRDGAWLQMARDAAVRLEADLLVTLGAEGSAFVGRDGTLHRATACRVDPVDTTGAGDTYVGVFAAALLEHGSVPEAMEAASVAAALACERHGVQVAQPTREAIDARRVREDRRRTP